MPTFGRIGLSQSEIGHILNREPEKIQLSLWDRFCDLFRPETKRDTVDNLAKLMQEPGLDAQVYLQNFEALVSHAKPEELHQFSLKVVSDADKRIAKLEFQVAGHTVAAPEIGIEGHLDDLDDLAGYAALHELRGQAANPKSTHELYKWASHEDITMLIEQSAWHVQGTRHRYGEFVREVQRKIADAGGGGAPRPQEQYPPTLNPFDERSQSASLLPHAPDEGVSLEHPTRPTGLTPSRAPSTKLIEGGYQPLSAPAAASAPDVLESIDEQLTALAGPRVMVRDIESFEVDNPQKHLLTVRSLIDRDADFSGVSVRDLLERGADFTDVSIKMLQAANVSFDGVDLCALRDRHTWTHDVSLAELIALGIKGGDTPVFEESAGIHRAPIPIYERPESPKLKLPVLLDAGFTVEQVPVRHLAEHFDLRGCPFNSLVEAKVGFFGSDLEQLRNFGVDFRGVRAASLLALGIPLTTPARPGQPQSASTGTGVTVQKLDEMGISLEGARVTQLFSQGLKLSGCKLDALLKARADVLDLELRTFVAGGGECAGVNLRRLKEEGMKLTDVSFEDLRAAGVSTQGVTAAELIDWAEVKGTRVQQLIDAEVAAEGISVKTLLGHEVSFAGADMTAVRRWNPDMNGCFVDTLLRQGASFGGASVKWLKDSGASLAGVTYARLRDAGCDFSGLTAADVTDLSRIKGFFENVSVGDLLAAPDLDVTGWRLEDLTQAGAKLENVSTDQLLQRGVRLDGALAGGLIETRGTSVRLLLSHGASFAGTRMASLHSQNADVNGTFIRTLLDGGADFGGASVKWLKESGASFAGVTYTQLRQAGCDFSGLTPRALAELGRDKAFYQGTSLSDLLEAPDVNLVGAKLADLPGAHQLAGVSILAALRKGVSLSGLRLDQLMADKADLRGCHVLDLQKSGLAFPNVQFPTLLREGISFVKARVSDLDQGIHFNGYLGRHAIENGLRFDSQEDFREFEARGGTVLEQQAAPSRGNTGPRT
jgi:uncharacterized protein YjbI with pentapeptide repeats